jgi:hypothetical protein
VENPITAECNNCPIAANQTEATVTEPTAQPQTPSTVGRQVRTRTGEAVRDAFHSGVAVGKTATVATAAGIVGLSNGIAKGSRTLGSKCDSLSARMKVWILSR